jgi:glycosyltransferase involved in cell wall biosynthesis
VTVVCGAGTPVVERVAGKGVETVLVDADANVATATWELRRVLHERFVEVAFVHADREQLVVSSAMRLAERGAVIRRVPPFARLDDDTGSFAVRVAASGLLFATEGERVAATSRGWKIPATVAPLGVDLADYDVPPTARSTLGVPPQSTVIVCPYDEASGDRLATIMRTLALLGRRHRDLHAVVFGAGASNEKLRIHAAALSVASFMTFIDDTDDVRGIMQAADIVWIAAAGDQGAFGFLDAMALRLPIVAERTPLSEHFLADGVTGVVLATGQVMTIASAVTALLAYPERRAAMGNAGRARAQREFAEAAMIDGFERAGANAGDRTMWAVH